MAGIYYNAHPYPSQNLSQAQEPVKSAVVTSFPAVSQPSRKTVALMMAGVIMLWPEVNAEMRPQPPKRIQIAPLTLVYGQQPPRRLLGNWGRIEIASWPDNSSFILRVSPVCLAQPPPVSFVPYNPTALKTLLLNCLWPTPNLQSDAMGWVEKSAPLTLTYGQQPPVTTIEEMMAQVAQMWPDINPFVYPPQTLIKIAPLTLIYGQDPPRRLQGLANVTERSAWIVDWISQEEPFYPQTLQVQTFVPYNPQGNLAVSNWIVPAFNVPALVDIAPLTLVYGQQPPALLLGGRSRREIDSWPEVNSFIYPPQGLEQFVQGFVIQPFIPGNAQTIFNLILASWNAPDFTLLKRVQFAPLSLVYGQQPPIVTVGEMIGLISSLWPEVNPVIYPPQTLVKVAPLTLIYGQQPPRQLLGLRNNNERLQWAVDWGTQHGIYFPQGIAVSAIFVPARERTFKDRRTDIAFKDTRTNNTFKDRRTNISFKEPLV